MPGAPQPDLRPGEMRSFDFVANPGTHWMHLHSPVQEIELLAAPLIVHRPEDIAANRQEVTILLHDLSFRPADEVLAEITGGMLGMAGMDHGSTGSGGGMSGLGGMMGGMSVMDHGTMGGMAMGAIDMNDFAFDADPATDRTLPFSGATA